MVIGKLLTYRMCFSIVWGINFTQNFGNTTNFQQNNLADSSGTLAHFEGEKVHICQVKPIQRPEPACMIHIAPHHARVPRGKTFSPSYRARSKYTLCDCQFFVPLNCDMF